MKKLCMIAIPLILIIFPLALSGCINIKVTEKSGTTKVIDKDMNFTVTTETNPNFLEEPEDEELRFFDSIKNSIETYSSDDFTIKKFDEENIIKIIEKEEANLIFSLHKEEKIDYIYTFKLRKKIENNIILYSEPIYSVDYTWKLGKWWTKELAKRSEEDEVLKYKILSDLQAFNNLGIYNLGETNGKVQWGYTDDPNIKNLTINGQKPTEIIELKMDGDDVYFWYYENLEVDYDNIMDMEILY